MVIAGGVSSPAAAAQLVSIPPMIMTMTMIPPRGLPPEEIAPSRFAGLASVWIHSWNCTSARGVAHELGMSCFAKNNLSLSLASGPSIAGSRLVYYSPMKVDALYTEGVNLRVLKDQPGQDLISLIG